jgi:hypothetical protein
LHPSAITLDGDPVASVEGQRSPQEADRRAGFLVGQDLGASAGSDAVAFPTPPQ